MIKEIKEKAENETIIEIKQKLADEDLKIDVLKEIAEEQKDKNKRIHKKYKDAVNKNEKLIKKLKKIDKELNELRNGKEIEKDEKKKKKEEKSSTNVNKEMKKQKEKERKEKEA